MTPLAFPLSLALASALAASDPSTSTPTAKLPAAHPERSARGAGAESKGHPSFRVRVEGRGPPMIFIPGLSSSGEVWDGLVPHFARDHACHVLTLAGFAGVPPVPAPLVETARRELAAYLRANRLEGAIVVGHSLGGALALSLAEAEPDLVSAVVIVDAFPFLPAARYPGATAEGVRPHAERAREALRGATPAQRRAQQREALRTMITDPAQVERAATWGDASDPGAVADAVYEAMTTDLRPGLGRIAAPVLVVGTWVALQGLATRVAVEATFREQYAGVPRLTVTVHPTARHFVMLDDPSGLEREVDAFLGRAAPLR